MDADQLQRVSSAISHCTPHTEDNVMRRIRSLLAVVVAVSSIGMLAASPASAQTTQDGLVNVNVQDVTIQVPIAIAANLCDINVNVLARQERMGGAECDATADSVASPGTGGGGAPVDQDGLVNVNVADLVVQLPVALAANVCDVNVNLLAEQLLLPGGAECDAVADSGAGGPGMRAFG